MDTNNNNQLNKLLDLHNEAQEILWEHIAGNKVDKHTVWHIKRQLKQALESIPYKKYEEIRKEIYDCLQVIKM